MPVTPTIQYDNGKPFVILPDNRKCYLVDSGCDISPRLYFVWLGQISPDFAAVLGGGEDDAVEEFADFIDFKGLNNEHINQLCKELIEDGVAEDEAFGEATAGMLPLNGGAEWIDDGEYGFWHPTKEDRKICRELLTTIRKGETK